MAAHSERPPWKLPLLPTTVVGSYPIPEWMERLNTDYYRRRMSQAQLRDVHETAIKAAILDQERVGIDIVSDGELRRDNDLDYFLSRLPGAEITETVKEFYFDYYDVRLTSPISPSDTPSMALADDYAFTASQTDGPIKFSFTGPLSLSHGLRDNVYGNRRELVLAIAQQLHAEAQALAERGARLLQIDEMFLAGHRDEAALAMEAINVITADVDVVWALHVCYGNRYARPLWEGHYGFLFPAVLDANVDQLVLEFARKGYEDLELIEKHRWDRTLGLGVIDVKNEQVESPELVAARIRLALNVLPPERLVINPDCGFRNLTRPVALAKLTAMVEGTAMVRESLTTPAPDGAPGAPHEALTRAAPADSVAEGA